MRFSVLDCIRVSGVSGFEFLNFVSGFPVSGFGWFGFLVLTFEVQV